MVRDARGSISISDDSCLAQRDIGIIHTHVRDSHPAGRPFPSIANQFDSGPSRLALSGPAYAHLSTHTEMLSRDLA